MLRCLALAVQCLGSSLEAPGEKRKRDDFQPVSADLIRCPICLGNESPIVHTNCNHPFHPDCLRNWLLVRAVCPTCKSPQERPIETDAERIAREADERETARLNAIADERAAAEVAHDVAAAGQADQPNADDDRQLQAAILRSMRELSQADQAEEIDTESNETDEEESAGWVEEPNSPVDGDY